MGSAGKVPDLLKLNSKGVAWYRLAVLTVVGVRSQETPIPQKLDHYRVIRKIGGGGQGDVYLAHDPNLDIEVAIKVLRPDFRTDEIIERFKVEARTAVRMTHPNVVRVYSFNPEHPYLVMEWQDCHNRHRI